MASLDPLLGLSGFLDNSKVPNFLSYCHGNSPCEIPHVSSRQDFNIAFVLPCIIGLIPSILHRIYDNHATDFMANVHTYWRNHKLHFVRTNNSPQLSRLTRLGERKKQKEFESSADGIKLKKTFNKSQVSRFYDLMYKPSPVFLLETLVRAALRLSRRYCWIYRSLIGLH